MVKTDANEIDDIIQSIIMELDSLTKSDDCYYDEPIIQVASKMRNYLPEKCRQLRKMSQYSHNSAHFYKQAEFMADYEDDFEYNGSFLKYYPSYDDMNDAQLRGYFSWRTKVRHGEIQKTSLSFVFVYVYELINLIGVSSPEKGYYTLKNFWQEYRKFDTSLDRYVRMWLGDFAVYYNLPKSFHPDFGNSDSVNRFVILNNYREHSDDDIFGALLNASTYNIENSRFYKQYPDDFKAVTVAVYKSMSEYFEKNRKNSYCEKLFGRLFEFEYRIFQSAYFLDKKHYKDYEYALNDAQVYRCKRGRWSKTSVVGSANMKSSELGVTMRAVDRIMRSRYGFAYPIKDDGKATKILVGFVEKSVGELLEKKKQKELEARRIKIDTSLLSGIRQAAEKTRDKLIVEEENEAEEEKIPEIIEDTPIDEPQETETDLPLDENEYEFMRLFLYGGDYMSFLRQKNIMLSMIADSVNEKLFDLFGDTVILFDSDSPELIEDYVPELKGLIKQ